MLTGSEPSHPATLRTSPCRRTLGVTEVKCPPTWLLPYKADATRECPDGLGDAWALCPISAFLVRTSKVAQPEGEAACPGAFGGKPAPAHSPGAGLAANLLPAWTCLKLPSQGEELRQLLGIGRPWSPGAVPAGLGRVGSPLSLIDLTTEALQSTLLSHSVKVWKNGKPGPTGCFWGRGQGGR